MNPMKGEKGDMNISLRSIVPGTKVRLKPEVLRQMTVRQWIFQGIDKDNIAWLMHDSGHYGIGVDAELVDLAGLF